VNNPFAVCEGFTQSSFFQMAVGSRNVNLKASGVDLESCVPVRNASSLIAGGKIRFRSIGQHLCAFVLATYGAIEIRNCLFESTEFKVGSSPIISASCPIRKQADDCIQVFQSLSPIFLPS
jgi:hypothetical protein